MKWPRSGNFKMTHNASLPPNSMTNFLRRAALEAQADAGTVASFPAANSTLREGCVD